MRIYQVPLGNLPMEYDIDIEGRSYRFRTQYREAVDGGWLLDIDKAPTREPLVHGIPLVPGLDLLWQYHYLEFGFHLMVTGKEAPGKLDLGTNNFLVALVD